MSTEAREIRVGQTYRSDLGGPPMAVVGFDGNLVLVKGAREPKKNLVHTRGAHSISRGDIAGWVLLEEK